MKKNTSLRCHGPQLPTEIRTPLTCFGFSRLFEFATLSVVPVLVRVVSRVLTKPRAHSYSRSRWIDQYEYRALAAWPKIRQISVRLVEKHSLRISHGVGVSYQTSRTTSVAASNSRRHGAGWLPGPVVSQHGPTTHEQLSGHRYNGFLLTSLLPVAEPLIHGPRPRVVS